MSKREAPEYVAEWQKCNNTDNRYEISFINGGYYVYLKKVAGKNERAYIGSLKEDGLHSKKSQNHKDSPKPEQIVNQTERPQLEVTESANLISREFGFSKAIIDLCPQSWKDVIGKYWESALRDIILHYSNNSYLLSSSVLTSNRKHYNGAATVFLNRSLPVSIREIFDVLSPVILNISGDQRIISTLSSQQREFCNKYGIHLEVM